MYTHTEHTTSDTLTKTVFKASLLFRCKATAARLLAKPHLQTQNNYKHSMQYSYFNTRMVILLTLKKYLLIEGDVKVKYSGFTAQVRWASDLFWTRSSVFTHNGGPCGPLTGRTSKVALICLTEFSNLKIRLHYTEIVIKITYEYL